MTEIFVIVTALNEAERIQATLAGLSTAFPGAPVWVADDGSRDATPRLARAAGARVVRSERVIGKGAAATLAAGAALLYARPSGDGGRPGSVFVLCDGDLGESSVELSVLAEAVAAARADIAVGAFAVRAGGGLGVALAFARWAVRRRCGASTRAPISGQRALSRDALEDVLPFANGFGMEVGMTIDAVRAGYELVEIELDLGHRVSGRTPGGFAHRARQLADFVRVYLARR